MKGTVEQVMSGELFSGLLLDDADQRALALEAVLGKVVDDDTRVLWVGNPLRSPLTIERFLIQIVGPEIDLRSERSPAEIARLIAKPVGRETRLLIVVQQPETINAETLDQLVEMGGHLGGEAIQLQFLFAGPPSFQVPQLAKPTIASFPPPREDVEWPTVEPADYRARRSDLVPLLLLLIAITIGVVVAIVSASKDPSPPAPVTPPPVAAPAAPPPDPAVSHDIVLLRREFDTFLSQRKPPGPPMTESEKDALFHGFLTYHRRE